MHGNHIHHNGHIDYIVPSYQHRVYQSYPYGGGYGYGYPSNGINVYGRNFGVRVGF